MVMNRKSCAGIRSRSWSWLGSVAKARRVRAGRRCNPAELRRGQCARGEAAEAGVAVPAPAPSQTRHPGKGGSARIQTAFSLPPPGLPSPPACGAGTRIGTGSSAMKVRRGKASAEFATPLPTPRSQNGFFHLFLLQVTDPVVSHPFSVLRKAFCQGWV